ncbi:hypothetical protein L6452_05321 [Arctium lappa]|uniref:Uncharacterized protein n=1 Tax=Arctium lappa TaxID=4217 RepID=A0ACB9EFH9_ARCLA|nr:hypothetical protein L6452_05321 [Arctium lappa]
MASGYSSASIKFVLFQNCHLLLPPPPLPSPHRAVQHGETTFSFTAIDDWFSSMARRQIRVSSLVLKSTTGFRVWLSMGDLAWFGVHQLTC